jgi:predicted metal-binding membrane protein
MNTKTTYRSWLAASLGGTVVAAWALLWWLERTPWGALLHAHGGAHAHAGHGQPLPVTAAAFVVGWTLMTVAMMLPSTFPLMEIFRRLVRRRRHPALLAGVLSGGYLLVWAALGALVFGGGQAFAGLELPLPAWAPAAGLFLLAGAFQFSALKYRCLEQCRAPLGFVLSRWGRREGEVRRAWRIGVDHGLYCAGCCWALMLLMFAAASANLLWMFALGLIMAVEKNASWGRRIGEPLGVVLLIAAVAIAGAGMAGY